MMWDVIWIFIKFIFLLVCAIIILLSVGKSD